MKGLIVILLLTTFGCKAQRSLHTPLQLDTMYMQAVTQYGNATNCTMYFQSTVDSIIFGGIDFPPVHGLKHIGTLYFVPQWQLMKTVCDSIPSDSSIYVGN